MNILLLVILLFPLLGFLINGIYGEKLGKKLSGILGSLVVFVSFLGSIAAFLDAGALTSAKVVYFNILDFAELKIEFALQADRLTSAMMLVVTGIGFLIHLYSTAYMHEDAGMHKFFAYLNLFIFSMLTLIMGANFLLLFIGWEGVGLCSYLLIGFWFKNKEYGYAARKAFIMNRIGDLGLLLALFLIIHHFKSLDYATVFAACASPVNNNVANTIAVLLFIGAMGKSAQIPLFTWLPDAMAGPTPVSALIHAATMVTAGIYLVVRCQTLYFWAPETREFIMWIGLATSILAALIGLKQNDIKKVLAYSTVSQLGLMFVALGCGAYTAAMFHVITHAFFKALLFLGSGSVIHAMHHEQDIRKMGGLKKSLPITYITFLIGTLAITGFPFLSGFFSKDEILLSAFLHNPVVWALGLGSAAITAFYMWRMFFVTFHGNFRGTDDQKHHLHESPWQMTLPLIVLAFFSILGGVINLPHYTGSIAQKLHHWFEPIAAPNVENHAVSLSLELSLATAAVAAFLLGFLWMRNKYISKNIVPESDEKMMGIGKTLAHKLYIDEMYNSTFVEPTAATGSVLTNSIEEKVLQKGFNGIGTIKLKIAQGLSKIQNGNIEYYLIFMVIMLIGILTFNFFQA